MPPKTMFEKIWDAHVVHEEPGQSTLLYIDLHLVHEVTSPQAFEGLRLAGRKVRRTDLTVATVDHNTPTWELSRPVEDDMSKKQLEALTRNCEEFGVTLYDRFSSRQGIVHIIGPEQGYTQPGKTIVCGDSHTATPRRLRGLRPGHRHDPGGAGAGDPVPGPGQAQPHGGPRQRPAAPPGSRPRT